MSNEDTKAELIENARNSYEKLQRYVAEIAGRDIDKYKNKDGWKVKDYIIHLAIWEKGIVDLLNHNSRFTAMGVPPELLEEWDLAKINRVIHDDNQHLSLQDTIRELEHVHQAMINTLEELTPEDLDKPYSHYDPNVPFSDPVVNWIGPNTHAHYDEHLISIQKIMES